MAAPVSSASLGFSAGVDTRRMHSRRPRSQRLLCLELLVAASIRGTVLSSIGILFGLNTFRVERRGKV
jgi:hypothetical protein